MKSKQITDSIYCIRADLYDLPFFEGIWSLPTGVTINSYLVRGQKTALIDLVEDAADAPAQFESALSGLGCDFSSIDYLILNHLEPDHSGYLKEFRVKNPRAVIVSTEKGIKLIEAFYGITDNTRAVKSGDSIDLGGKTLVFYETPNIHWPETMMTWQPESGTLFSCDGFGSFGALGNSVFDDELTPEQLRAYDAESLRYYANIVASFSSFVTSAIKKLDELKILNALACVAPSHGIVYRKNPRGIVEQYARYASYAKQGEKEIAVVWGSMYGNTKRGLDAVIKGIEAEGVPYTLCRVPNDHISDILAAAYKSAGIVLAMPTYEYAMFPPMAWTLDMFKRKHINGKTALRIGSWGWSGGAKREYDALLESLKWTSVEPVEWQGCPTAETESLLEQRGRELAKAVLAL
ncbi:MAG: FprA family A-type flavoprotein [Treponemataceae bacterium]|nr:MAG: FprA family A-type flavoprotein [Treponemataceae bacterium]